MAVQSRFLQTPTGQTYAPARDIERSFDKTSGIITNAINQNQERIRQEEAAFGQLYSNLGEIEANLQENYAGINQQMVDSTREFMKEHYKKGGRSTDPDFQATLGQMTGRIKAGAANADRNREMLRQSAELIKADPAIVDKASALAGLYQKMQDPDFLISQNQFNPEDYLSNFISPNKVWESVAKALPTTGEKGWQYTDADGNLRNRTILMNPLINEAAPIGEDGRVNLNITPDFTKEIMSGAYGPRAIDQVLRTANEKYSNLPTDVAMQMAIKDGLSGVMGVNMSDKVIKNARDIERENQQLSRQNQELDLKIRREQRLAGQMDQMEEDQNRYNQFINAISSGDLGFFGEYNNQKSGVSDVKIIDRYAPEREIQKAASSPEDWSKLTKDERVEIIESLGVEGKIPKVLGITGPWQTNTEEARTAVKSAIDDLLKDKPQGMTGLTYKVKTGTKDGEAIYEDRELPLLNQNEIEYAFRELENLRRGTGGKLKPVTEVDVPAEIDLTQKDYWK